MVRRWLLMILAFGLGLGPVAAFAQSEVFTVHNVKVDATSDGAARARDIALAEGQHTAFRRLMQRLTRRQDWGYLPQVSGEDLSNLILGIEVAQERSSATRYIATVTYSFKPNAIRVLLRQAGIAFSEARARPALVLPVLETPSGTVLWQDPNPWRQAWARRNLSDELMPILSPLGDIGDSNLIGADRAKSANWSEVAPIAHKYGVDRVIVAVARSDEAGNLDVRLRQLSASQDSATQFSFTGGGDLAGQLEQAIDSGLNRLYEQWKAATIVTFGRENTLVAAVTFTSLQEWLTIRQRLAQAPTVTDVDLLGISPFGAQVRLHYAGTVDQLRITFDQIGLTVNQQGNGWLIGMTEAGGTSLPLAASSVDDIGARASRDGATAAARAISDSQGSAAEPDSTTSPAFWNVEHSKIQPAPHGTEPANATVDPSLITKVPSTQD